MIAVRSLLLAGLAFCGQRLRHTRLSRSALITGLHAALGLWLHRTHYARVGPFRVHFDPRDRVIAKKLVLYGAYEAHEIALLCSLVRPGDHVLDVGANIGLYSLFLSQAVGPNGRVIAVEPDPDNLALLRSNVRVNKCDNVTVVPGAFGTTTGWAQLFQNDDNRGHLSLADLTGEARAVRIPVLRGDETLTKLQVNPACAKIDVEGAEPLVLAGLGAYKPPVLLFEFAPPLLRAHGHPPEGLLQDLVTDGYRLAIVDPDTGAHRPQTPQEILFATNSSPHLCNILAVRAV